MKRLFGMLKSKVKLTENEKIQIEWDRLRSRAMTPSERNEIDAIFARQM